MNELKRIIIQFSYDGETVLAAGNTTLQHGQIFHLASYQGKPFTVGSVDHTKSEIMDVIHNKWNMVSEYPFHQR